MKKQKKILTAIGTCLMAVGMFALAGCGTTGGATPNPDPVPEPNPTPEIVTTYARYAKSDDGTYVKDDEGGYIHFGYYPQSLKDPFVTLSEEADEDGYYTGSDNYKYVKYHMAIEEYGVDLGYSYFKVEPLMWRILKEEDGKALILSEKIIDQSYFNQYCKYNNEDNKYYKTDGEDDDANYVLDDNGDKILANNYEHSDLREFLNTVFYSTAFSETQRALIVDTTVDNSAATTNSETNPYACANTTDKVFALSYQDVYNTEYGFKAADYAGIDNEKCPSATDYANYKGASREVFGMSYVWLRSPYSDDSGGAFCVRESGVGNDSVDSGDLGVLPALQITLE